jgi:hypothetical protein
MLAVPLFGFKIVSILRAPFERDNSCPLRLVFVQEYPKKKSPPRVASRTHTMSLGQSIGRSGDKISLTYRATVRDTDVSRFLHNDPAVHPDGSTTTIIRGGLPVHVGSNDRRTSHITRCHRLIWVLVRAVWSVLPSSTSSKCMIVRQIACGFMQRQKQIVIFFQPLYGALCTRRSF